MKWLVKDYPTHSTPGIFAGKFIESADGAWQIHRQPNGWILVDKIGIVSGKGTAYRVKYLREAKQLAEHVNRDLTGESANHA